MQNVISDAVVIKGTQIYDSGKGAFVDLGILDVLQIFGRAGSFPSLYDPSSGGYDEVDADRFLHCQVDRNTSRKELDTFARLPINSITTFQPSRSNIPLNPSELTYAIPSSWPSITETDPADSQPDSSRDSSIPSTPKSALALLRIWTREFGGSGTRICSCACARIPSSMGW